jgi:predicted ATPase
LYAAAPCDNANVLGKNEGFLREVRLTRERVPDFEQYPYSIPAVRTLETLKLDPRVTILAGENGTGKSTLVEAIAVLAGFNPEGGTKNSPTLTSRRNPRSSITSSSSAA